MKIWNKCGYDIELGESVVLKRHESTNVKKELWKQVFASRKPIRDAVASGHLLVAPETKKEIE